MLRVPQLQAGFRGATIFTNFRCSTTISRRVGSGQSSRSQTGYIRYSSTGAIRTLDLTPLDLVPPRFYGRIALSFKTSAPAGRLLPRLQAALNQTCRSIPWLAGRVLATSDEGDRHPGLQVRWKDGESPILRDLGTLSGSFVEAEASGMPARTIPEEQWAMPGRIDERLAAEGPPVFAAGLLSFEKDDGVVLCVCIHHSVVDGGGYAEILRIWSNILSGISASSEFQPERNSRLCASLRPHMGKTWASSHKTLLASNPGYVTKPLPFKPDFASCTNAVLPVDRLKAGLGTHTVVPPTTNTIICAIIWCSLMRARQRRNPALFLGDSKSNLGMPVDGRRRVHPDFSSAEDPYFGNFYTYTMTQLQASAFSGADDPSLYPLARICDAIALSISADRLNARNIAEVYALAARSQSAPALFPAWSISSGRDIGITSWAGFGLYEMSFGDALGQPIFVRPPYMQIDSAAIVLPRKRACFDEEDRDTIEVMLMLRKDDIEALQQDGVWKMLASEPKRTRASVIPASPQSELYAPYAAMPGRRSMEVPMV
ncbi:hypothetical protein LTR94_016865 [Friedmanniomyces endolithicus]|nr:hypothetical protein LTR94_016865 [Friedmanniomyces endolithicus]